MVERIAKQEACQLFIEQEIEKGLAAGKSKYAIGKEVSQWLKEKLGIGYKAQTISKRAQRIAIGTNVPKPTTPRLKDTKATVEYSKVGASTGQLRLKGSLDYLIEIKRLWTCLTPWQQEEFYDWAFFKFGGSPKERNGLRYCDNLKCKNRKKRIENKN